ncbi:MAG: hypothetical protein A3I61_03375 [Acidobacteria bacterium RIFCSPLOWO2_02_FULL_68_18]|nr:MAG: hypothetical protein A3I61_03375 [Acidobacteria bacterium RIFCSPLOWO2_02_FULL_68_18]OFW48314.1 MAG: hypothetical protein A3G77_03460 [Acidobacteria bacterium RIFCSPLOWO2_12_FULL_68_19]
MSDETLVMTATFRPAADTPGLVVCDERERMVQYLCALVSWARPAHVRRIVFGENSNTRFDFSRVTQYLQAAGKEVEVLVFDGNREVVRFGKGYGEGEILEHVYRHSRLLRAAPAFYKVTGRLYVGNFDAVSEATSTLDAFQRKVKQPKDGPPRPCKVVTTFFKCSLALFERRLVRAYTQVDDLHGVFIEHVYYNQLREVDAPSFSVRPTLVGQQASTGRVYGAYDEGVVRTAQSFVASPAVASTRPQRLAQ